MAAPPASASAVGTPAAAMTSLAKLFEPSIRAAARPGPKTHSVVSECVRDARDEGRFRADHRQVHVEAAGEAEQRLGIFGPHRMAVADVAVARISGRGMERCETRRLRQLPRERVLATARPNQEHLHGGRVYSPRVSCQPRQRMTLP